jgi:hypothetical protein
VIDFGFWIADFGPRAQSKIRNPKSKMKKNGPHHPKQFREVGRMQAVQF